MQPPHDKGSNLLQACAVLRRYWLRNWSGAAEAFAEYEEYLYHDNGKGAPHTPPDEDEHLKHIESVKKQCVYLRGVYS